MSRFWVIGGEFADTAFASLTGAGEVHGPYADRGQAEQAWRKVSSEHSHKCLVRYTVVQEPIRQPAAA